MPEAAIATPRRTAALAGVLVATGLLAWSAAPGALLRLAPVSLEFAADAPAGVVEGFNGPDGAYVVGYAHDHYLDVDLVLANAGVVRVAVEEVALDLQAAPLLVPAEAATAVEVGRGDRAITAMRLRFDNCEAYHEREAMVVDGVTVRARVLGRTVTERVPLDRPLMARSPMLWECPDRTLDRSDDRREGVAVSR